MSTTTEVDLGFVYLLDRMQADSTLMGYVTGIYRQFAPTTAVAPYLLLIFQAGTTVTTFGGVRSHASLLYQVKAVGPARLLSTLVSAAARLDSVVSTAQSVNVTGGSILKCMQEQPFHLDELVAKEQWTNKGGLYRLYVKAT